MIDRFNLPKAALVLVAFVALLVVIAHMSCIWFGPECFVIQRAPASIIESSREGSWFAPLGTTFVSSLFLLSAGYALSAAKIIKKLPYLKLAVMVIGSICIARSIVVIPLLYKHAHLRSQFEIAACIVWFIGGVLILWGYKRVASANIKEK